MARIYGHVPDWKWGKKFFTRNLSAETIHHHHHHHHYHRILDISVLKSKTWKISENLFKQRKEDGVISLRICLSNYISNYFKTPKWCQNYAWKSMKVVREKNIKVLVKVIMNYLQYSSHNVLLHNLDRIYIFLWRSHSFLGCCI